MTISKLIEFMETIDKNLANEDLHIQRENFDSDDLITFDNYMALKKDLEKYKEENTDKANKLIENNGMLIYAMANLVFTREQLEEVL